MDYRDVVIALEALGHGPRAGRAADQHAPQVGKPRARGVEVLEQLEPDRRHRRRHGDAGLLQQGVQGSAVEARARQHQSRARHRGEERQRPAVGVEQRHHRHRHVAALEPEIVWAVVHQGVEHVRAVRVEYALRVAGRAGGITQACGRLLVELGPGEIRVGFRDPVLVRHGVAQAGLRPVRGVGEEDEALDGRQRRGDPLDERQEGQVEEEDPILGMVDDVGDLLLAQPGIDRVVDRAEASDSVPRLQVPPRVPGQRRHPVADLDAVALQPLREPARPLMDRRVGRAVHRPLDRARDHRPVRMLRPGVIEDAVDEQRPVLHQADHGVVLRPLPEAPGLQAGVANWRRGPSPSSLGDSRMAARG